MPSWSYKDRPKAILPDKGEVEGLVSDLMKRIRIQKAKIEKEDKKAELRAKNQKGEKRDNQYLPKRSEPLSLGEVDLSNNVGVVTGANVAARKVSPEDIIRAQKLAQLEKLREENALKTMRASNSEYLPKFSLAQGTAQVFESLTRCVAALNCEQHEMFESKRDAQKKLATAEIELNVLEKYSVKKYKPDILMQYFVKSDHNSSKKYNIDIPTELLFELYGIISWAQFYIDHDRQGPKVDWFVRKSFECLYYDWMILTGTEPVFRAAPGDNKKAVGQAGIFISEAWALMFPKTRHVLPPRTMRDWADDLKAGGATDDPKQGRLRALAYLPTE